MSTLEEQKQLAVTRITDMLLTTRAEGFATGIEASRAAVAHVVARYLLAVDREEDLRVARECLAAIRDLAEGKLP